jgi:type II secretory pathway component PulK
MKEAKVRVNASSIHHAGRGAVLLLVLGAVAILSLLAVELSQRARLDVSRASRSARDGVFRRGIDSGVELAKGLLNERRKGAGYDAWSDGWSKAIQVEPEPGVKVTVQLSDESGKLNIAKAMSGAGETGDVAWTRKALTRLLAHLRKHDMARQADWDSIDAAVRQRLGINGGGKAQPLLTLDGLRECGVPFEIIYGSPKTADQPALCNVMTTFGGSRVNLNTASAAVLNALDEEYDENLVASILQWRGGESGGVPDAYLPFKTAKDLEAVDGILIRATQNGQPIVVKNLLTKVENRVSTQSLCFSARITVETERGTREAWAFFESASTSRNALNLICCEEPAP